MKRNRVHNANGFLYFFDSHLKLKRTKWPSSSNEDRVFEDVFSFQAESSDFKEECSFSSSNSHLVFSDGNGRLIILNSSSFSSKDGEKSSRSNGLLYDGGLEDGIGRNFFVCGSQEERNGNGDEKDFSLLIFLKEVVDSSSNPSSNSKISSSISFVQKEKNGSNSEDHSNSSSSDKTAKMEVNPQSSSRSNVENGQFLLHVVRFSIVKDEKKIELLDTLSSSSDFDHFVRLQHSNRFLVIGSSPYIPSTCSVSEFKFQNEESEHKKAYRDIGKDTDFGSFSRLFLDPIEFSNLTKTDPKMLEMIRERLAPLTTESEVNPYANMDLQSHEDFEDFHPTDSISLFSWAYQVKENGRVGLLGKLSLEGIQFLSFMDSKENEKDSNGNQLVGRLGELFSISYRSIRCLMIHLVGGFDVDVVIMRMVLSNNGELRLIHEERDRPQTC